MSINVVGFVTQLNALVSHYWYVCNLMAVCKMHDDTKRPGMPHGSVISRSGQSQT